MPSKPTVGVSTVGSQKDSRYLDTFYDQHKSPKFPEGRPWHGYREFAANKPDKDGFVGGELTPGRHAEDMEDRKAAWETAWVAPWVPEYKYFEFNYARSKITIRYDRVFGDDKTAQDNYYRAAAKLSGANGWGPVQYGIMPNYQVTALIGDPPRSPKIAQAAQAGDPWLLGSSDEVNEELAQLIGLTQEGLVLVDETKEPPFKPEQIIAADALDIPKMIAEAVALALKSEREANAKRMAHARSKRKPTTATPEAA